MARTVEKHLAAIKSGQVSKTNIYGIRKTLNAWGRISRGYSVGRATPIVIDGDAIALQRALQEYRPQVAGELHESGLRVLRNPRYAKRWTPEQRHAIENLDHFRLIGFEDCGTFGLPAHVPIYEVWARDPMGMLEWAFTFQNRAWQSGGDGPEVTLTNRSPRKLCPG